MAGGTAFINLYDMGALGAEENIENHEVEHIAARLLADGLIERAGGRSFKVGPELALYYELTFDRHADVKANVLRRELLRDGVAAYLDSTESPVLTRDDRGRLAEYEWGELIAATEVLELVGLLEPRRGMGSLRTVATPNGYDVWRDETTLIETLPVTLAEAEDAHALIAPDALAPLIRNCKQMLTERGWTGETGLFLCLTIRRRLVALAWGGPDGGFYGTARRGRPGARTESPRWRLALVRVLCVRRRMEARAAR
jgi:hypothetical protein